MTDVSTQKSLIEKILFFSWILYTLGLFVSTSILVVGSTLCLPLGLYLYRKKNFLKLPLGLPIVLFSLSVLISIGVAVFFVQGDNGPLYLSSFKRAFFKLRYFVLYFLFVFFGKTYYASTKEYMRESMFRWLRYCLYIFSFVYGVIACFEFFGLFDFLSFFHLISTGITPFHENLQYFHGRVFFHHHNVLGGECVFILSYLIGFFVSEDKTRPLTFVAIMFAMLGLLCSGSRGAWISFACGILSFFLFVEVFFQSFLFPRQQKKYGYSRIAPKTMFIFGLGLLCIGLVELFPPLRARLFSLTLSSNQDRLFLWAMAWEMFLRYPLFGVGYIAGYKLVTNRFSAIVTKSFPHLQPFVGSIPDNAHNSYLDVLATSGGVGFVSFIYLLSKTLRRVIQNMKQPQTPLHKGLLYGSFIYCISFMVGSFFDSHIHLVHSINNFIYVCIVSELCSAEKR